MANSAENIKWLSVEENKMQLLFRIGADGSVKFVHFGKEPFEKESLSEEELRGFRLVELELAGVDRPQERHGMKYVVTAPGYRLVYDSHKDYRNADGRKLELITKDVETDVFVTSHFQFYDGISTVRTWQEVENRGSEERILTYLSIFNLNGIEKEGVLRTDEKLRIGIPHHSWQRELQWKFYSPAQLGMEQMQEGERIRSSKTIGATNTGNWSAKEYLPMGSVENTETGKTYIWQIEHNGSWHWEISDQTGHLYLQLSGPTENESHWVKRLKPGDKFTSVTAAVSVSDGFTNGIGELTKYRRRIRRPNTDNEKLCVIFNDYMNCLWADPTTEKELPLIEAAQQAGCEYYCIDAGWYDEGYWWDSVGEWMPSRKRFPGGLKEVTDAIRAHGMIPGLWLEIEVMGIKCRLAEEVAKDWFFVRHGKKVYDRSRYQLDFRNPEVRKYADGVIDRLVTEYGIGYIKMDYNIEPGIGTELYADSFGDGLLSHERAYLAWIDGLFARYPELIIENCSSGGLRMDYAMLQRHSIQSTSDQEDYRHYASIAANAPTALTPEQAAVWSYPLRNADAEQTVFNMVNAMLLRVHQSGNLAELSPLCSALVKEGIDCYKRIREDVKSGLPFWPIGLSAFSDAWSCLGLQYEGGAYLALWKRRAETDELTLPMGQFAGKKIEAKLLYPLTEAETLEDCSYCWNEKTGLFSVKLPGAYRARLFKLTEESKKEGEA